MDMPLQHASRSMLARMKRGSSGDAFLRLIERIRATIPGVMLRTSFIVGFPGETPADFRELERFRARGGIRLDGRLRLLRRGQRRQPRAGAKVDADTIAERRDHLMAMQRRISARRLRRFVGQKLTPWWKGRRRIPNWSGKRASKAWRRKLTAKYI